MPFSFKNRYRPLPWLITQLFFVVQHQSPCLYLGFLFSLDHLNLICTFHLLFPFSFECSTSHWQPKHLQRLLPSLETRFASFHGHIFVNWLFPMSIYRLSIHRSFSFILAIFAPFLSSQQVRCFSYSSVYKWYFFHFLVRVFHSFTCFRSLSIPLLFLLLFIKASSWVFFTLVLYTFICLRS